MDVLIGALYALFSHLAHTVANCSRIAAFVLIAVGYAALWAEFFLLEIVGLITYTLTGSLSRGLFVVAVPFLGLTILLACEASSFLDTAPLWYSYPVTGLLSTAWLSTTSLLLHDMTPAELFGSWPNPPFCSLTMAIITPVMRLSSKLGSHLYTHCIEPTAARQAVPSDPVPIKTEQPCTAITPLDHSPLSEIHYTGLFGEADYIPPSISEEDAAREIKHWREFNYQRLDQNKSEKQYAAEHAELLAYIMSFKIPRKPRKLHPSTLFPIGPESEAYKKWEARRTSMFTTVSDELQAITTTATPSPPAPYNLPPVDEVEEAPAQASNGVSSSSPVRITAFEADEIPTESLDSTVTEPVVPPTHIHTRTPSPIEGPVSPQAIEQSDPVTPQVPQYKTAAASPSPPLPIKPATSAHTTPARATSPAPQKKSVHFKTPEVEPETPIEISTQSSQPPKTPAATMAPTHGEEHRTASPETVSMLDTTPLIAHPPTTVGGSSILQTLTIAPTPNPPLNVLNVLGMPSSGWLPHPTTQNASIHHAQVTQAPVSEAQHVQSPLKVPSHHTMQPTMYWQPSHLPVPTMSATHLVAPTFGFDTPQQSFFQPPQPVETQDIEMGEGPIVENVARTQQASSSTRVQTQDVPDAMNMLPFTVLQHSEQNIPQASQGTLQPLSTSRAQQTKPKTSPSADMMSQLAMLAANEYMAKMDIDGRCKAWDYITKHVWPQKPVSEKVLVSAYDIPFEELSALTKPQGFELVTRLKGIAFHAERDRQRAASATLSPAVSARRPIVAPSSAHTALIDPALLGPAQSAPVPLTPTPMAPASSHPVVIQSSNMPDSTLGAASMVAGRRIPPMRRRRGGLR